MEGCNDVDVTWQPWRLPYTQLCSLRLLRNRTPQTTPSCISWHEIGSPWFYVCVHLRKDGAKNSSGFLPPLSLILSQFPVVTISNSLCSVGKHKRMSVSLSTAPCKLGFGLGPGPPKSVHCFFVVLITYQQLRIMYLDDRANKYGSGRSCWKK